MPLKTLEQFLESDLPNAWIKFECLAIYVRKSHRINLNKDNVKATPVPVFDIANIETTKQGTGAFTRFLHHLEAVLKSTKLQIIYVENLLNNRLYNFLKRDFNFIDTNTFNDSYGLPCVYKSLKDL